MSYSRKSLDELNVLDDFLINAIASDPEVGAPFCRTLLSVLLQREIGKVRVIAQRSIPAPSPNMKGIRMDVEVVEIEGADQEKSEGGSSKGGCKAIHSMLKYLQTSTPNNATDSATRKMHGFVSRVKTQPEVRLEYMTFEDYIYFERRDAAREAAQKAAQKAAQEATQEARVQSILELLEDYGEVPEELMDYLNAQTNLSVLKEWLKLAARTSDLETFMEQIGCSATTVS